MKEIDVTEDIFRLFRKMTSEIEGLKSLMLEGENKGKEDTFDPFKRIVLSPEGYKRFKEIDEAPLTEEKKEVIKKFKKDVNADERWIDRLNKNLYGTMEDKEWIHEKGNTNTPPKTVPEKPSVGNKKKSDLRTREEIEQKILELRTALKYADIQRAKIIGKLEGLEWVIKNR